MENLAAHETLTPDPLPAESSDLATETLAPAENNAVSDTPFTAGDFIWAKGKGPFWWPALVSPEMKNGSVLVSYFGDYDTLAWCEPKQLKPFLKVFDEMSKQSRSSSFVRALESCMGEIEGSLRLEMSCHCVPAEARPKLMVEGGRKEVPIGNISMGEFVGWVSDAAKDVFVVNALEILQLKSWVFGYGKVLVEGGSWEFSRRRGIEDLVDRIDLDALPVEMVGGKEEEGEEGLVLGVSNRRRRRRKRSVPKEICEMGLDVLMAGDGDGEKEMVVVVEEERSLRSKKRKSKEKLEVVKAEEEIGSSSGRRERKKSKYLSPPYTNLREVGKFLATLPRNLEEKTLRKAASFSDHSGEEDDKNSCLVKIQKTPTVEFYSEFVASAENPLHLKGFRAAKVVKYFFAVYRKFKYSGGAENEDYKKLVSESIAKTEISADNAGKREHNDSDNKHGACKETSLGFKQRKSNGKHRTDQETKLDSEDPKTSRRSEIFRGDGLSSKQKESYIMIKGRLRRKKMSKDGTGQGTTIDLGSQVEDALGEEEAGRKSRNNKRGSRKALVDSDHCIANASDEGKEKKNTRWKKKNMSDGISKGALANIDLHMEDVSGECKPGRGRKRCRNDANGEAAVNVDLQIVSSLHEGGSGKKERLRKEAAVNSRKPASMKEKKMGSKENANGRSSQNLGFGGTKFSKGGQSGSKKAKPGRRKAKRGNPTYGRQAALQLTFHSGIALPSVEDLITSYKKYGALVDAGVELFEESNSARVVFVKAADAETAFKDKAGPYGSVANYRLHYLAENLIDPSQPNHDLIPSTSLQISDVISPSQQTPDPKSAALKPPLPYIRKSLETMISTLAWSSSSVVSGSSSDGLKPEARDNLVGEMQGLLQKVEKMLTGPGSTSST